MNIKEILADPVKTDEFIQENRGLVLNVIKKTYPSVLNTYEEEDCVQEGLIALYKAMKDFDETKAKNFKFSTFAYFVIRKKIIDKIKCDKNKLRQSNKSATSLNIKISEDETDSDEFINTLVDNIDIENEVITKIEDEELMYIINNKLLHRLNPDLRDVLTHLLNNKSQSDIARLRGCSRENIRQKVNKIKNKARILKIA